MALNISITDQSTPITVTDVTNQPTVDEAAETILITENITPISVTTAPSPITIAVDTIATPGPTGPAGDAGEDGNTILTGTTDPLPGTGVDGDFFINTTTYDIFGPKTAGDWGTGTSLVGPTGPGATQLDELTDVSNATQLLRNVLVSNGTTFESRPLTEADLSDLQSYLVNLVEDTTPQLGGDLDVNGNSIVSTSNGNINLTPNGTGSVVLDGNAMPQDAGAANQVLQTDGLGQTTWVDPPVTGLENVVEDTTPQLGGNLDVNGNSITSISNGDISITPDGTGNVIIDGNKLPQDSGTVDQLLQTDGAGQTSWVDAPVTGLENVVEDTTPQLGGDLDVNGQNIVSAAAGNINITPDTTGSVVIDGNAMPQDQGAANQVLTTDGAGQTSWAENVLDVIDDTTPQLGGDLDTNGFDITAPTSVDLDITGGVSAQLNISQGAGVAANLNLNGQAFPAADGTAGQKLSTDGAGEMSWVDDTQQSTELAWTFETDITTTNMSQDVDIIRYNNATPASITEIYISEQSNSSGIVSSLIDTLALDDHIRVQRSDNSNRRMIFKVTAVPIKDTGGPGPNNWYTIGVTPTNAGASVPNGGDLCGVHFYKSSQGFLVDDPNPTLSADMELNGNSILETGGDGVMRLTSSSQVIELWTATSPTLRFNASGNIHGFLNANGANMTLQTDSNLLKFSTGGGANGGTIQLNNDNWPTVQGTNSQVLSTTGAGSLYWRDIDDGLF